MDADTFQRERAPGRELEVGLPRKRDLPVTDGPMTKADAQARREAQPFVCVATQSARALVGHCSATSIMPWP